MDRHQVRRLIAIVVVLGFFPFLWFFWIPFLKIQWGYEYPVELINGFAYLLYTVIGFYFGTRFIEGFLTPKVKDLASLAKALNIPEAEKLDVERLREAVKKAVDKLT
jgi:hypothetical protein